MFEALRIRAKVLVMALAVAIPATVVVGAMGYVSGKAAIRQAKLDHLTSIRASKASQIESYFGQIRNQARTFSEDRMVVEAMRGLSGAFADFEGETPATGESERLADYYETVFGARLASLGPEAPAASALLPTTNAAAYLQARYIVENPNPAGRKDLLDTADDGSRYADLHGVYHPVLRSFQSTFGYYDLFLIDRSGNIVYSVFKETDFGTNLEDGPYRDSNLANAFRSARDSEEPDAVHLVDFEAYVPSYGAPASFIASAIFDDGRPIGVLAFQMPVGEINRVMTGGGRWREDGLGESGETYLVGPDSRMRSVSRFFVEDPDGYFSALRSYGVAGDELARIRSNGTSILVQQVQTAASTAALAGDTASDIVADYRGIRVLSSYAPLDIEGVSWAILSEVDEAEAFAPINALARSLALSMAGILLLVFLLSTYFSGTLVAPIHALASGARRFMDGEHDVQVEPKGQDELGELTRSFNQMVGDIDRQKTELAESASRTQAIVETAVDAIITIDERGTMLSFNSAASEMFGYAVEEVVGENVKMLTSETHRDQHDQYLRNYMETGERKIIGNARQEWGRHKDGSEFPIVLGVSEVHLEGGRIFTGIITDISAQKAAEDALRQHQEDLERTVEERTRELKRSADELENVSSVILRWAPDGTVLFLNRFGQELFGFREEEIVGQPLMGTLVPESDTTGRNLRTMIDDILEHPARYESNDNENLTKDGRRVWMAWRNKPIANPDGSLKEILTVGIDITEQKDAEAKLAEAADAAEVANRAKSTFLANMSHELRTPMNAIIGYSEMLWEDAEDEGHDEMVPDLKKINTAGKHLLALINDILDLSKIEAGKMELFLETFDVEDMVREVAETVGPLLAKNDNELALELEPGLGTARLDLMKLRQSLMNLLSNAAKFTHAGKVTVRAERAVRGAHSWLVLSVQDSGIGIPEDRIALVFEEFKQADDSTTREYGGTGLGLPISRRFCQMMGGDITVTSKPGAGSCFTIELPVVSGSEAGPADSEALPTVPGGPLVLVVDDDPNARDLMRRTLEADGYGVVMAADGHEALELASKLQPDLITLDVMMPEMDGWTVLRELKASEEAREIPVVVASIVADREVGYSLGAVDALTKPVDRKALLNLVHQHVDAGEGQRALVVEDDPATRERERRILEQDGWTVDEAEDGAVGMEKALASPPDLVLLDLMMPVMDGFEFVAEFRKHESLRDVPIVVLTAMDLTREVRDRLNGGVEKIVGKGDDVTDSLLRQVRRVLGHK
jgi:PAS domain S-box-containing protein